MYSKILAYESIHLLYYSICNDHRWVKDLPMALMAMGTEDGIVKLLNGEQGRVIGEAACNSAATQNNILTGNVPMTSSISSNCSIRA